MRKTIFALASSALIMGAVVVGCGGGGGGTTVHNDGGVKPDLSSTPTDMASLTCAGYIACQNTCQQANASSTDPNAVSDCDTNTCDTQVSIAITNPKIYTSSATAADKPGIFDDAVQCIVEYCIGSNFDMPYECGVTSTGSLTDPGTTMLSNSGVCNTCLNDGLSGLYGASCTNASGPDCSATMGSKAYTACNTKFLACTNH